MNREIVRRSIVYDDLHDLADYIARNNLVAAIRFLDEAEKTFSTLAENPSPGNPCEFRKPELQGIRQWHIRGFRNYLIFYFSNETEIEIVRVLHAARDWMTFFEKEG